MSESLADLRKAYFDLTGKSHSIRWNRQTLRKRIADFQALQIGHAALDKKQSPSLDSDVPNVADPESDFVKLVTGDKVKIAGTEKQDGDLIVEEKVEGPGGVRDGAGRRPGQTDERARIERLLNLKVPDLGVKKFVQGLNLILKRFSHLPFEEKQVESIALGLTLPLYFWFPGVEGAANKWTLHIQALEDIAVPLKERTDLINELMEKEQEDGEKEENKKDEGPEKGDPDANLKT